MGKTLIAVRGVDEDAFRKFRALTIEERMKLGDALTMAMKHWLEEGKKRAGPDPKNLLKIKPITIGKKKVRWSDEIDEFLYGKSL
ncbi:MAG: hypothetical protein HYW24_04495 [Candidatus Aenigmarchaeota archaeon]|nr:hypothetical protein [Candidatus Aenigmarchaeota archaeon]